jgi:hypothetical protein
MTPSLYTTALGPLCHRTFDHFTSRPLRSGRVPAPAPCFGRPGPLHITSPPFRPGPCARALLRLARLLHYHVPSVQAGSLRPRPDSDSLDSNHVPLIRPAHIVRPGFSRALGSHPGPGLCSQRPRARDTGARTPDTTTEPSSACAFPLPRKGNCGRAGPSTQQVQARSTLGMLGRTSWTPSTSCTATPPLARNLVYSHTRPTAQAPLAGASLAESTFIGGPGRSHPPLLLSGRGCKWGPNPLGSIEQTWKTQVERA